MGVKAVGQTVEALPTAALNQYGAHKVRMVLAAVGVLVLDNCRFP